MFILSIACLVGFISLSFKNSLRYVVIYLIITTFVEWLGFYFLYWDTDKAVKPILYTLYGPFEFLFIGLYFYQVLKSKLKGLLIVLLGVPVLLIFFASLIKQNFENIADYKAFLYPSFCFILLCIWYLRELLNSEMDLRTNPHFWIVTGMLVFNTGFFFLSGFLNSLVIQNPLLARSLFSINHFLNIIYYSLITYGFYIQWKSTKSSLSS